MHIRCVRLAALAIVTFLMLLPMLSRAKEKPVDKTEPFSEAVAERLMRQVRDGLIARNADTVLAAFDRDNMTGYREFAAQLHEFLRTWDNVRVYYQILQTVDTQCDTACGSASIQFQIEGEDALGQRAAMRRGSQLEVAFRRGDQGWKIANLAPRDIFQ